MGTVERGSERQIRGRRITAWRSVASAFALLGGLVGGAACVAQSIDTGMARATVGQPLHLVLRVRDFEASPAPLGRDCVRAEVRQGAESAPHQPLSWSHTARAVDGETWVTLSDPSPVREPLLHVRAALVCGAQLVREFTLLADAPETRPASADGVAGAPTSRSPLASASRRNGSGPATRPLRIEPPAAGQRGDAPQRTQDAAAGGASRPTASAADPTGPRSTAAAVSTLATALDATPAMARTLSPARIEPGPQGSSASPLSDAFVQLWHQDMRALHDEQRQSRALLASLSARLERTERETGQWAVIAGTAALGLLGLAVVMRWVRDLRRPRVQGPWTPSIRSGRPATALSNGSASAAEAASATRVDPTLDAPPPGAAPAPPLVHDTGFTAETPDPLTDFDDPTALRRPSSAFGQPALDEWRHAELLDQVDRMSAEGYLGASVAVLENALQGRVGKSPGILLRLLDHYDALHQPWNRERVGAELAAIYNVELPAGAVYGESSEDGECVDTGTGPARRPDEGASIDALGPVWSAIQAAWPTAQASATLAATLVRPSRHPPLPLAAFRDALWLHTLSTMRESAPPDHRLAVAHAVPPTSESAAATAAADALPALQWTLEPVNS